MPAERLLQFFLAHLRQHDVLDDDGVATDAGSNTRGPYLVFAEDVSDDVGDVVELHDLAINNRVGLQVFEAEIEKLESRRLCDRARQPSRRWSRYRDQRGSFFPRIF